MILLARAKDAEFWQMVIFALAASAVILVFILVKRKRQRGWPSPRRIVPPPPPPPQGGWPPSAREVQANLDRLRAVQATSASAAAKRGPAQLQLDAGAFKPVTDRQATAEARGIGNLWGNPWFGRRDLIPPAEDPRTNLIDRAMVGHGLITPEDLVEIHTI